MPLARSRQKDIPIPAPPRLDTPLHESRQSNPAQGGVSYLSFQAPWLHVAGAPAGTRALSFLSRQSPSGFKCSRLRGTASQRATYHSRVNVPPTRDGLATEL